MVKDEWLLETSRDCFCFVTKFFEPINASATHIYYSALELSPASSIVWKLYYERCDRIALLPRVLVGTPDSWDQRVSLSNKDCEHYESCTWSPCGRFIAAQTRTTVEIRNQLTLELFITLQPTEPVNQLTGPLAYAPDGRSLACASQTGILIWDIQTGGVAKEIACGPNITSMVWSPDGRSIATTSGLPQLADPYVLWSIRTYNVASGIGLCVEGLQSYGTPYLWAHKKSFQIASVSSKRGCTTIEIFEIGSALIQVHSFNITDLGIQFFEAIWSISPSTSRFFISAPYGLYIFDYRNSYVLLKETGCFKSHCFSSDGTFFAATNEDVVHIWRYCPGRYAPWKTFLSRSFVICPLHFSPTASSILECIANTLQVWRLHDLPTSFSRARDKYAGVSPSGNYVAMADKYGRTVTIIGLHSQAPQFVDAGVDIIGLFLTGNVLLVHGQRVVVAWLLTEKGRVAGVSVNRWAHHHNRIWEVRIYNYGALPNLMVDAGSRVGAIGECLEDPPLLTYHTETGEAPPSASKLNPIYSRPLDLVGVFRGRDYDAIDWPIRRSDWSTSRPTLQDGWVKDPEGSCRLWVPVEWRDCWDIAD